MGPAGRTELALAKEALAQFDLVIVLEWLSSASFGKHLAKKFCYDPSLVVRLNEKWHGQDGTKNHTTHTIQHGGDDEVYHDPPPGLSVIGGKEKPVPDLRRRRSGGDLRGPNTNHKP